MNYYTVDLDTVYGRTNVYDFPKAAVVDMSNHTGARWKYWYELLKKKKRAQMTRLYHTPYLGISDRPTFISYSRVCKWASSLSGHFYLL